jgi:hypothetical protein
MGVKQLGSGMEHPSPSDTEVEEGVEQYIQSPPNHIFIPCYGVNFTSFTHITGFMGSALPILTEKLEKIVCIGTCTYRIISNISTCIHKSNAVYL